MTMPAMTVPMPVLAAAVSLLLVFLFAMSLLLLVFLHLMLDGVRTQSAYNSTTQSTNHPTLNFMANESPACRPKHCRTESSFPFAGSTGSTWCARLQGREMVNLRLPSMTTIIGLILPRGWGVSAVGLGAGIITWTSLRRGTRAIGNRLLRLVVALLRWWRLVLLRWILRLSVIWLSILWLPVLWLLTVGILRWIALGRGAVISLMFAGRGSTILPLMGMVAVVVVRHGYTERLRIFLVEQGRSKNLKESE